MAEFYVRYLLSKYAVGIMSYIIVRRKMLLSLKSNNFHPIIIHLKVLSSAKHIFPVFLISMQKQNKKYFPISAYWQNRRVEFIFELYFCSIISLHIHIHGFWFVHIRDFLHCEYRITLAGISFKIREIMFRYRWNF